MHYTYSPRAESRESRALTVAEIERHLHVASSDNVPSARRSLIAASKMAQLVHLATDGKLNLELRDDAGNKIDFLSAIGAANSNPEA